MTWAELVHECNEIISKAAKKLMVIFKKMFW